MKKRALLGIVLIFSLMYLVSAFHSTDFKNCSTECRTTQKEGLDSCKANYETCKQECNDSSCTKNCSKEKTACVRNANENYKECKKDCKAEVMPKCLNETYKYGETFAQGCELCECKANGKVSCKKESFCNLNVTVSEEECSQNGGFYQALCNGPYFGIVCSQKEFCICGGDNNFTCPADYQCLTDFVSPNKRTTIGGWKTLLGNPLGEIGVCGKNNTFA